MRTLMEYAPPNQLAATHADVPALEPTGPEPEPAPPEAFGTESKLKKTIAQFPTVDAKPLVRPAAGSAPVLPSAEGLAARLPAAKTMLGMPAADTGMPAPAQPEPSAQPEPPQGKTMLGVAIPGIAPLNPGVPQPPQPPVGGTILGVAMPGIAPLQAGPSTPEPAPPPRVVRPAPPLAPIVPAPAPLVDDEALPMAPARGTRSGVPIALVAGGLALVLLVGGGIIAFLWKGSAPIVAHPTLDSQGKEALHLTCEGCTDGTGVALDGAKAEFKNHEADLVLSKPLSIGENPLTLQLKRTGMGRDEAVKIVVPIEFRIRADMTNVSAKPPVITVKVETQPGTNVQIDGKPLALDAKGEGSYAIDVSADVEGPNPELKRIDKKIPYVITPKNGARAQGTVPAAIGITQLVLDAPGTHAVTDQKSFLVAGQTSIGSTVTVNGEAVPVDDRGAFAKSIDAKAPGEVPIDVVGTAAQLAARTVHFTVKRVDSIEAEARAAEATTPLLYDAVKDDIASHAGQRVVFEGEIVETRGVAGHQTIIVLTDKRGCAAKADPNQCLARVLVGGEDKHKKGDKIRVFGRITRAVTAQNGKSVPEIEAEFVAKPK